MRAIDTNVVIRLIIRDDLRQAGAADAFVADGAWVSLVALAETAWVIRSVYGLSAPETAKAIELLLQHRNLAIQDPDVVIAALAHFRSRPALGFSDCLMVEIARKAGHSPLGTFDRALSKLDGAERIG
jgi:predicted nucleic-acid-binding protein